MSPDPTFNRPPRIRPRWAAAQIDLPAPPPPRRREPIAWSAMLLPIAGAAVIALAASLGGGSALLVALPAGAMALLGAAAALLAQRASSRRAAADYAARLALFEDGLEEGRRRLRRLYQAELSARLTLAPDPAGLLQIVGAHDPAARPEPRLWERRPGDDDFLELRAGCGSLPAAAQAAAPALAGEGDPALLLRARRVAEEYATLRQVPICIPLASLGSLGLAGPRAPALAALRALIWQAAALHAPVDLRVALVAPPAAAHEWAWLRWLPHTTPLDDDPDPALRMCAADPAAAARVASALLDQLSRRGPAADPGAGPRPAPAILLIVDGPELLQAHPGLAEVLRRGRDMALHTLVLAPAWPLLPEDCAALLEIQPSGALWTRAGQPWPGERFSLDQVDLSASDRLARRLSGLRLREAGAGNELPRAVRLLDLLGAAAAPAAAARWAVEPAAAWHPDVPIGAGADGQPVYLDLNEGRHGPHGIIAGATGAGKSVLLQSLVAALAATHAPARLNLLLIDFKGGAALEMLSRLPHCAGLVTDLEGAMAARATVAITSELRRRKRLLQQAGAAHAAKVENIADYRALARERGLPPLPNLLIVVDEFDELARSYPAFVAELVRVVKQGRSLGVHLLLATQQPARAVTDEIRSQLSYFIALRLGSPEDSREMLLKPDAAFLPGDRPGRAYFRAGAAVELFQAALVTGPHRPAAEAEAAPRISFVGAPAAPARPAAPAGPRQTDLDALTGALLAACPERAAPVWLPPLPPRLSLEGLAAPAAGLAAPVGLLDLPQATSQEPLSIDLESAHLAVVGGPGSGKTGLLQALTLGLAGRRSPAELWCYLIDGGQGLATLAGLPHVGAHIQVRERARLRRLFRMLGATIRARQDLLSESGASGPAAYRAAGGLMPAILVVCDGVAALRESFRDAYGDDGAVDELQRLARSGRAVGVHLALAADRPADLGHRLLPLCEARVALRLPDLHEYADLLGARVAAPVPPGRPGRALWAHPDHGPLELQVGLPVSSGAAPEDGLPGVDPAALAERVAAIAAAWPEPGAGWPAPVRLLPEQIALDPQVTPPPDAGPAELIAPVGLEGGLLGPAWLRLAPDTPHALVLGPRRSGKSAALRTIVAALTARHPATRLFILDGPRGALADLRGLPQLAAYAADEPAAAALAAALAAERALGPGPRLVVVDDYHLCRERMRGQLSQGYGPEPTLLDLLGDIAQAGGRSGDHLLVAAGLSYPDDGLLRALDAARSGLILWPGRYEPGTRLLGLGLPLAEQRDAEQPPGRAALVREDELLLVQIALHHP